jgi:hypothetical protein
MFKPLSNTFSIYRERMTIYLIWKFRIAVYHESGIKNIAKYCMQMN